MTVIFEYTPYAQAATDRLIVANQIAIMTALQSLLLLTNGSAATLNQRPLNQRLTESDEWLSVARESVRGYEVPQAER